jgi:hypothetical protein
MDLWSADVVENRGAMTVNPTRKVLAISAALLLIAFNSEIDLAGIQGTGKNAVVRGPITSFGSIFLDGVEYTTSGANITIDDQPGSEAQLRAGQIVTIDGTVDDDGTTGTATTVSFTGNVQGTATQINTSNNTFVVLGQTVRVTGSTLYDDGIQPADLTGLLAGTPVEVSGFADANGDIVASRVDLKPVGSTLQVSGTVAALDTVAHTFRINGLIVDYGTVSIPNSLANGSMVVVQGATLETTGALLATRVDPATGLGAAVNDYVDLTGIITNVVSLLEFTLQGQLVVIDLNTQLVLNGIPLGLNVEVDVQGTETAPGVILAKRIVVKSHEQSLLRGVVDSVAVVGNTLSVLGVNVATGPSTEMADKSSQHLRFFGLNDVHLGDYVEIHGTQGPNGTVAAATLERLNPQSLSYLQGPASQGTAISVPLLGVNVGLPSLSVLGVPVATNGQTLVSGLNGLKIDLASLLSQTPSRVVKVSGTYSGGVLTADHMQIQH